MRGLVASSLSSVALLLSALPAYADEAPPRPIEPAPAEPKPAEVPTPAEPKAEPAAAEPTPAEALAAVKKELGAIEGPSKAAPIGDIATVDVPAGYWFVPREGTVAFDRLMENIHDPESMGVLIKGDLETAVYFSFSPIGYVKDDESDLNADDLMKSLREGSTQQNIQRKAQGMAEIEIVGWTKEPFYNKTTRSLEWATRFKNVGDTGNGTVNYNTRRLGREGVMAVVLATAPDNVEKAVVEMNANLGAFGFLPGKDYASFQEGDRVAEIALGGLVAGGAAVALAKVGFFKKFWKILVAAGAGVVGLFAKLFGGKKKTDEVVANDDGPKLGDG
ncbi:MAG: DUF2167 domain-containing protein [Deltaproteobacteria bacterium]|nr:DUF2167 domain-containing protein [Deltaproteobacteria bacterium]